MNDFENAKKKGLAALTANPNITNCKPKFTDNSSFNQRLKLLDYFLEHNSITTQTAREKLDIYHPPARIKELREAGYLINTVWERWTSDFGIKHRIARYVLTQKQPVEHDNDCEVAV